ncbi:alpha/beta fold hydrolase [Candidatus Parcubacteria bacterium]|nr:alpha/beta fold hydrolase [Candidatus Parcubacteria bacterium]
MDKKGINKGINKDEFTIAEHRFKTNDGIHKLYVQEWGNPDGTPILFLHGGPGSRCSDRHKIPYNPKKHYVIFFDQRGCGQSQPNASLKHNETNYLIEDMELIRNKLKLKSFSINGGSWGSTLGLCYAIAHPDRVISMVLNGVFLATKAEIEWFERGGYKQFFPEVFEFLATGVPDSHLNNPGAYHRQKFITEGRKESAYRYSEAELKVLRLNNQYIPPPYSNEYDTTYGTLITHYMDKACFIKENYILKNASKLTMPVHIVHGRYDMVCQPINAYNLHKKLPESNIYWTMAGHAGSDRSNFDVLSTIYQLIY